MHNNDIYHAKPTSDNNIWYTGKNEVEHKMINYALYMFDVH